tara:strand:+ start:313 stop:912 length:600 start_codon:yes stop_codon:yes gene_type:complete
MHSYEVLSKEPLIVLLDKFLDKEDCKRILKLQIQLENSTTSTNRIKDYRKSLVTLVDEEDSIIKKVKKKIAKSFGLDGKGMEKMQLQKYPEGGYYKEHFDAKSEDHYQKDKSFSQRKYSIIIYLNDNFIGGETVFPKKNISVKPLQGRLLLFSNMLNETNYVHPFSSHLSNKIVKGEKWILSTWHHSFSKEVRNISLNN